MLDVVQFVTHTQRINRFVCHWSYILFVCHRKECGKYSSW